MAPGRRALSNQADIDDTGQMRALINPVFDQFGDADIWTASTRLAPAFNSAVRSAPQAVTPTLVSAPPRSKCRPAIAARRGTATISAHVPSHRENRQPAAMHNDSHIL